MCERCLSHISHLRLKSVPGIHREESTFVRIRNNSDCCERTQAVNRHWLFVLNLITGAQVFLLAFFKLVSSGRHTDFHAHNFSWDQRKLLARCTFGVLREDWRGCAKIWNSRLHVHRFRSVARSRASCSAIRRRTYSMYSARESREFVHTRPANVPSRC
jgi:hypothetical protein